MNTYTVTDFGIVPGLSTPQTEKFQQLIDRCKAEGGGKILFPARAGVIPARLGVSGEGKTFPRTRGGDPLMVAES